MTLNDRFVTLMLPGTRQRLGAIALGVVFAFVWIVTLGAETLSMALFALGIIALFESQKYFNRHASVERIAVDKAVGVAYAVLIASATAMTLHLPYATFIAALSAAALFERIDAKAPSTVGWLRRRLANGFGVVLSSLLAGIAAGLAAALLFTLVAKTV